VSACVATARDRGSDGKEPLCAHFTLAEAREFLPWPEAAPAGFFRRARQEMRRRLFRLPHP
jgi:hypothetical protein